MSADHEQPQPLFAVVELFGHARIAGAVSEQTFGGCTMVRVDVPELNVTVEEYVSGQGYVKQARTIPAHTRSFGPGAIYAISWCDEATAVAAARDIQHEPLKLYAAKAAIAGLARNALPAPANSDDGREEFF